MPNQTIICPKCQTEISIDDVLTHQIEDKIKSKYESSNKIKEEELAQKQKELDEQNKKIENARQDLTTIVNQQVAAKLPEIEKKVKEEASEKAQKEYSEKLENIKADGEERDKQNKDLRDQISDLLKQLREMKTKDDQRDIEFQKKLMAEETVIKNKAKQEADDASQLKIAQVEKQLADVKNQLSEAQRKAEQGSQQTQGEVLELELEDMLRQEFTLDEIISVPKGINGADITQHIKDKFGQNCGIIVWEAKRAKDWKKEWVIKVKEDRNSQKANMAIIVSTVLPKEIKHFDVIDGVWISDFSSAIGLARALRRGIIDVYSAKQSAIGKNEKMEMLYSYLSGVEFKQKIECIVETFSSMKTSLDKEKIAYQKIWKTREEQINMVIDNTVGMYGSLGGLMGNALPKIDILELPEGEEQ